MKVATITSAQTTSKGEIKEKDQGTTKEMSKGKEAKSKKIVHPLTIDPLSGSSM